MSEQNIVNISEANLQQTLQQSMNVPVLFYFWSARSQHCEQLTPVLERLAAQYNGQFTLAKVDCDAEQMLASQFGLRAIPTVYLFQNGQPVDGFEGPQPEEAIRALLDKVLPREEELKAQQALALMQGRKIRRGITAAEGSLAAVESGQPDWSAAGGNADCPSPFR